MTDTTGATLTPETEEPEAVTEAVTEIRHRYTNALLLSLPVKSLVGADLSFKNLRGANLEGANLEDANLGGANLEDANLEGANLEDANLGGANLGGAYLGGAYLGGANFKFTDSTVLPTGETWKTYLNEVVPSLLTAGGKTIEQIVAAGAWNCHEWTNCPMATAFGVHTLDEIPVLLRPRADQFITLFDARLIPCPIAQGEEEKTGVG